jgi:tellurite resistance protein TerC
MHVNELPFINGGQHIEWAPNIDSLSSLGVIVVSIAVSAAVSVYSATRKTKQGQKG